MNTLSKSKGKTCNMFCMFFINIFTKELENFSHSCILCTNEHKNVEHVTLMQHFSQKRNRHKCNSLNNRKVRSIVFGWNESAE